MLDLLRSLWEIIAALFGLVPNFIWTAVGATIPIAVAAQLAIRRISHERRFDKNIEIYSKLYRATDQVAVHMPGSDKDAEQDKLAAASLQQMLDAHDEAQLHISPRSRVALQNLFENLRWLMYDAMDENSDSYRMSNRRANMLLRRMPEEILVLARRDLYGNEFWERVAFKMFWRRDRKRIVGVFSDVWRESEQTPLPTD